MNDPMLPLPGLSPVSGKTIVAKFDGGLLSSDGGILVLREVEQRLRVADRMAACIEEATVLDWLNAAEHKRLPPERMRPHAPQHWREFCAFMQVIHVPPTLADTIWREGIEPLRIDRRRAGARMAQAFVSVLVDPHGGVGSMPTDVKDGIARLRRQAMEHLDGVLAVRRQDQREGVDA